MFRALPSKVFRLRYMPAITLLVFLTPVGAGLISSVLPAFGYLPVLGRSDFSGEAWGQLLHHPAIPASIFTTITTGFAATIISLGLALFFVAAWYGSPSYKKTRKMLAPVLAIPHSALAIGLAFLIAPSGWIVRAITPWATGWDRPPDVAIIHDPYGLTLILGLVIKETPYFLLMILAALDQTQAEKRLTVARTLGYKPISAWIKAVQPAIYKQIRLPIFAVLAFSLSVVDVSLILGPSAPPPLSVLVLRWFNDPDLSYRFMASAGAMLQLMIVIAAISLWFVVEVGVSRIFRSRSSMGKRHFFETEIKLASKAGINFLVMLFSGSLLVLVTWSFTWRWRFPDFLPSVWSFHSWQNNLHNLAESAGTTIAVGLAGSIIAIILVVACLENEKQRGKNAGSGALWLVYLPLMIPQVSFLFGVQVISIKANIDSSWISVIWTHLLFVLPYVFLSLSDPYRSQDNRFFNLALTLGSTPSRAFWRIRLPLLLRPLLFAFAVGFAVSVAQYLPTLFAGGGRFATVTTEAVNLSASGNRRIVAVYALLQAILPLIVFAAAMRIPNFVFRNRQALKGS